MKKTLLLLAALLILSSHDMFLKLDSFLLEPRSYASIDLYNGTFTKSDNVITRDRMIDVSIAGDSRRTSVDSSLWTDDGGITRLNFTTGDPGTWVAGVSTRARNIELEAQSFNDYLKHDGVMDMYKWREDNNALNTDAVEKYSKHVKAIFQVGDLRSDDWKTILGYPIEFVPLSNPYEARVGDDISFDLYRKGKKLANQLVYVGSDHHHQHGHGHDSDDHEHHDTQLRTDSNGSVTIKVTNEGHWFVRAIHMEHSEEAGLTHESNWATLTFQVKGADGSSHGTHVHSDGTIHEDHDHRIPSWLYIVGGILLIAGIYFGLRRSK